MKKGVDFNNRELYKKAFLVVVAFLCVIFFIFPSVIAEECSCNNCSDCMDKLNNVSCTYVNLTQNITVTGDNCINDPDNFTNKTFDCQGFSINGSSGTGIELLNEKHNALIKNCIVSNFDYGIWVDGENISVLNNTITGSIWGLAVNIWSNYSNSTIKDNNLSGNQYNLVYGRIAGVDTFLNNTVDYKYKIYYNHSAQNYSFNQTSAPDAGMVICSNCTNITIKDLNLSHRNYAGAYLIHSRSSEVTNITSRDNWWGVYAYDSDNLTIQNNSVIRNNVAIYSLYLSNSIIKNNQINSSSNSGIYLNPGENNSIKENSLYYNDYGIEIDGASKNNSLENNSIFYSGDSGIILDTTSTTDTRISYNQVYNGSITGLYLSSENITVISNVFCFNTGVDLHNEGSSNITGENNTCDTNEGETEGFNDTGYVGCARYCNGSQGQRQTCSDGTVYGQCSSDKPNYCDDGILIENCSLCGCSSGSCRDDGACRSSGGGGGGGSGGCTSGQKRCLGTSLEQCLNNIWSLVENCGYGCNSTSLVCILNTSYQENNTNQTQENQTQENQTQTTCEEGYKLESGICTKIETQKPRGISLIWFVVIALIVVIGIIIIYFVISANAKKKRGY